jgi:Domain of unknown function (DUF5666)
LLKTFVILLAGCGCAAAFADTPSTTVRGTIATISDDAKSLTMKSRAGAEIKVQLEPKTRFVEVVRASAADLKPNSFIGVAAVPEPDGSLKALEVHIFPEAMRGTGEGFRPFDLAPNSSMTNGAINARIGGVAGDELTVAYKGGSQKIHLPAGTPIVTFAPGAETDLKAGAAAIVRGPKAADGDVEATAVLIGKDGLVPPM